MLRYDKPQKERFRQFHQLGVETYGNKNIEQEAELLNIIYRILKTLKISLSVIGPDLYGKKILKQNIVAARSYSFQKFSSQICTTFRWLLYHSKTLLHEIAQL